ncbi:MAG: GNAT family N-acetyltransferase, partial [Proteobacteria bacterium]
MITASLNKAKKISRAGRATMKATARAPFRALKKINPVKYLKDRQFPLRDFQTKVFVYQTTENFILKTVENVFELRQALKLRHEVFYKELQNKESGNDLDIDEFDSICDHLIIIDKKTSRVVGTYRMISSTFAEDFYSEGEFDIAAIKKLPGNKLELGRACIHEDFRTGAIINLLWKGIAEYIKKTETKYLFGCASVQTTDPVQASKLLAYLRSKDLSSEELGVKPAEKYRSEISIQAVDAADAKDIP